MPIAAELARAAPAAAGSAPRAALSRACRALTRRQDRCGYWLFELEADATIPAEYVLMTHYLGEVDGPLQAKLATYIRDRQLPSGGWSLFHGTEAELSCSIKAYYALKLAGDDPEADHMRLARQTVLALGGSSRANVLTRIFLALFGELPWRAAPHLPVEILLLPRWFPLHLSRVSYWSRTVMVPLLVLCSLKPRARNPSRLGIRELFVSPPETVGSFFEPRSNLNRLFLLADRLGRALERAIPPGLRRHALRIAERWIAARLNAESGLGGIFPATLNALLALDALGHGAEAPGVRDCKDALRRLLVERSKDAYCQPCQSPVWDTAWSVLALQEAQAPETEFALRRGLEWLAARQLDGEAGDWRDGLPGLAGGGWAFQFQNPHYPDLDDTAVAALSLSRSGDKDSTHRVLRAARWVGGMQSRNGGFGAFDRNCGSAFLNEIPFADHGALLDPPTADVSARCASLLAALVGAEPSHRPRLDRCLRFLTEEQEEDGAWYGRWGCNYIYGTWSALTALADAGVDPKDRRMRSAACWLLERQNDDGGWGEDNASYADRSFAGRGPSTSFQTAWALLGLMASGEVDSASVRRGIRYLIDTQRGDGLWSEPWFTAAGFPRVFYLKYHGYSVYFPLLALARYQNLADGPDP